VKPLKKRTLFLVLFILLIACAFTATVLYARAGGAGGYSDSGGGSSGGSGGGEGIGYLIYILIRIIIELPFPINIIVAGIIIAGFLIFSHITKKKVQQQTILNQLPTGDSTKKAGGYDSFLKNNPDFNETSFKENVTSAFMRIQKAWEVQDISDVRKFISDGVYQRFNTQFKMMQLLKQKNTINNLEVKNLYIDRVESDGLFDIIHVAIHASIEDRFISELDARLNQGGKEEFVEYWSFLKKRGKPRKDIYQTDNCPNCGAPLPEHMGEVSKCEMCGTLTNSGEYDWVLSEITQANDYIGTHKKLQKSSELNEKIRNIINEDQDFSVQLLEDKASNGYLQIITSIALKEPAIMRRFVNDEVFQKISGLIGEDQVAYNRIYLNDVTLLGVSETEDTHILAISVRSSFQRIILKDGAVTIVDPAVISKTEVLLMSRDKNATASKGSLYTHNCPNCGAPAENSLDINCQYCGMPLNSTSSEWIITGLMSIAEYNDYVSDNASQFSYKVNPDLLDKLYDVRDFAFNNVMVVMAADGNFSEEEEEFMRELAQKWGYDINRIQPFFQMALNGQLVIRMPEDLKKQQKIFKMMEKAAAADSSISPEEQDLLDRMRMQYHL